jgi:trk system potassium uptake protein TrkH
MRLFFESCSACGTVGLSANLTPELTLSGKLVIIFGMYAGRIGPLTLLLALTSKVKTARYSYPTEHVVIG